MAAALDPDEVLRSTAGKANFQRITRLLISGGTSLLREVFDAIHPPSNLPTILSNPATANLLKGAKLTKPQRDCLNPSPGVYGKSADFDVTLLFRLLRTICSLTPPPTGWDALPTSTDHSLPADLARVKYYRNSIYGHVSQGMEIKDDKFPSFWQEISETLVRIAGKISLPKKAAWQGAIDKLLNNPLTVEDERNVQELERWYESDMEVKKSIEEVCERMNRLEVGLEEIPNVVTKKVQEEGEGIKDQLGQIHRSIDRLDSSARALLQVLIDCIAIAESGSQGEATGITLAPSQPQAVVTTGSGGVNVGNKGTSSTQEVINLIASRYFLVNNPSTKEELNGFLEYMEKVRKVIVVDVKSGSLIITVECSSVQILDELWEDYFTGHLNEMAQKFLVTEDILKELGLIAIKLKTTILREEYRACREYLLQRPEESGIHKGDDASKRQEESLKVIEEEEKKMPEKRLKEIEEAQKEMLEGRKEMREKEIKWREAQKEMPEKRKRYEEKRKRYKEAEKEMREAQKEMPEKRKRYEEAEKEMREARKEMLEAQKEMPEKRKRYKEARKEMLEKEIKWREKRKRYQETLKEMLEAQKEMPEGDKEMQEERKMLEGWRKRFEESKKESPEKELKFSQEGRKGSLGRRKRLEGRRKRLEGRRKRLEEEELELSESSEEKELEFFKEGGKGSIEEELEFFKEGGKGSIEEESEFVKEMFKRDEEMDKALEEMDKALEEMFKRDEGRRKRLQGEELKFSQEGRKGSLEERKRLEEPREILDSHKQSEKQLQLKKGDKEHILEETSTNKGPGDSFGDLENAVSVSSFSPKVALPGKPGYSQEESLTAEVDLPVNVINDSPWSDTDILFTVVTSEGGVVTGENVKLVCPPGAVDNPVSVGIKLEDPSTYYGLLIRKDLERDVMFGAPIINLQPNGYFFKKPVTLTTKFEMKDFKCDDVLILHGTEASDGKITWQDITRNSQIDVTTQEVTIELEHFSPIVVLLRWTWIRGLDIVSRLNVLAFNYTLSMLLKKNSTLSVQDELALLFVSQDVYHEEFYHEQESSALVKLTKEQFTKLHVSTIGTQEEKRIYNNETLRVNIHLKDDYKLAESTIDIPLENDFELVDSQNGSIRFDVQSNIWWNAGRVIRLRLQKNRHVGRLCGTISVNGENGHTRECHFSEEVSDLPGYVRNLLGVEEAIFNVIPIAKSVAKLLEMPEKSMNEVTTRLIMKDEDEQLGIILKRWSGKKNVVEDLAALRNELEKLKQEDYKVTPRGQMHIRHLREFATKKADSRIFRTLCKSLLSDLCIELECSAEGVERAASSTNHADFFLVNHSTENHQPIPEDIARKYEQVCSSSEEPCLQTFLDITPYLIQNIKEIFVGHENIVPQNGLRGLSETKIVRFVSNILNAEQNENFGDLVFEVCQILEQLCLKNLDKQTTAEIKESAKSLEIRQMLKSLTCFFQHSQHDVRLHKRLHLFSRHLRDIMTKRLKSDDVYIYLHDFSNILLSLIHFAKSDSSKLMRFELTDSTNSLVLCSRENVTYDKHENTYSQRFRIKKQSEDELQLRAFANVSIDGRICKKGAFQSVIMLNASGEEAFDACMKRFDIAVMKLEDKSSGSLRLALCSSQKEKLVEALNALKRDLNEDLLDLRQSEITQCHLQMRSIDPAAGVVLSLRLVYKWGSEAVTLDSSDFVTFADTSAGGACIPEVKFQGLGDEQMAEGAAAFPLTSADGKFPLGSFDQLQKHARLVQCEKMELHLHQTVNQMTGHVCVAGDKATVNEQMPSQLALPEGPSAAPKRSITDSEA